MDYPTLLLLLVALVIFVYRVLSTKDSKELALFAAFLIAAFLLFRFEGVTSDALMSGVIIFNAILASYGKRSGIFFLMAGILYIFVTLGTTPTLVLQAAVIGALSATSPYTKPKKVHDAKMHTERPRNLFQIAAGIFLILLFLWIRTAVAETLLLSLFVTGIIILNYAINNPDSRIPKMLSSMERQGFYMGYGAIWLGIGAVFAAAFLGTTLSLVVFSAIFIGDSFSTLVGVRYGSVKLPYNPKKSIVGTLAYFLPVLAISYFVVGIWALPLALLAAFIESLPLPLDDNFSVSLVLTAVIFLIL